MNPTSVLFVCLGNICRSPTAEGVLRSLLQRDGLLEAIRVDSAGTGDWHIGRAPHGPALRAAADKGVDMSSLRARLVTPEDFQQFDYILAMDQMNLADLQRMQPTDYNGYLGRLSDFDAQSRGEDVADPYGGTSDDFDQAFDHIYRATSAFYQHLVSENS